MMPSPRSATPPPPRHQKKPLVVAEGVPDLRPAGSDGSETQQPLTEEQRINRYDTNHDGHLDEMELTIMKYDSNGDGNFSMTEVKAIITDLNTQKAAASQMKKVAIALFFALLAVYTMNFISTTWGISLMKDVEQQDSGVMTVSGTDTVVQVASSDFTIGEDGTLIMRSPSDSGRRLAEGESASTTIRTGQQMIEHSLTSTVPDQYLAELSAFKIMTSSGEETVLVQSFERVPQVNADCGSVVVLSTNKGLPPGPAHSTQSGLATALTVVVLQEISR